jgi:hypothetical protein
MSPLIKNVNERKNTSVIAPKMPLFELRNTMKADKGFPFHAKIGSVGRLATTALAKRAPLIPLWVLFENGDRIRKYVRGIDSRFLVN